MKKQSSKLSNGTVHSLPEDLRKVIESDSKVKAVWEGITPLARNEWICWVTSAKQEGTRIRRIAVGLDKMRSGMRRPCCWAGCIHRPDKPMSSAQQWVYGKRTKSK